MFEGFDNGLEAVIRPLGGEVEVNDGLLKAAVGGRAVLFVAVEHVGGGNDEAENLRGAVESRIGMARGLVRRAIGGSGAFAGPLDQHRVVGRGLVRIERPWKRPDGERVDHALRRLVALRGGEAIPVIGGAAPGVEHEREAELGFSVALTGRAHLPHNRLAVVPGHARAVVIRVPTRFVQK